MIAPSQGVHIVLHKRFLGGDTAIMVPRTRDGRVMFAIPWHDHTVVGTTDTPITDVSLEPKPLSRGDRLHPRNGERLPARAADAGRHPERLRRHPARW